MMKKLILLALVCFATLAEAQNQKGTFSIKPMAGINISTFGTPTIEDIYHAKVRFTAGVEGEYGVNDWLGLSLGLMYSQQGANIDGVVTTITPLDNDEILYSKSELDGYLHADYLNIPLMARFYIPSLRGLSFSAGVQLGLLVNDKTKTDVTNATIKISPSALDPNTVQEMYENTLVVTYGSVTLTDVCKSVDFGIPVGLSYEYKNVSLDARYYFGLTKMDKTENPDNAKHRYLSITLGYRFHL
ncbi:MAG: PorT family protein [Prevotella sp.]|jgi:hypothetical protein|nr:PorT family protein [Prevotella sp.]